MSIDFGTGPTLKEGCPWLRDDGERHRRILDVTERNSVIEGLPPFTAEVRARLREHLLAISATRPAPAEARPSLDDNHA